MPNGKHWTRDRRTNCLRMVDTKYPRDHGSLGCLFAELDKPFHVRCTLLEEAETPYCVK
jgi:hypothetical protein